jgi:hypothetical protein
MHPLECLFCTVGKLFISEDKAFTAHQPKDTGNAQGPWPLTFSLWFDKYNFTFACRVLILELLAPLREAMDIHVFEGRTTESMEHGIWHPCWMVLRAVQEQIWGLGTPNLQFQGPLM